MVLQKSDIAPEFTLKNQSGEDVSLRDFKGKFVVIYFYPKDDTHGCTVEAIDFSGLKKDFEREGVVILGVSKDSCLSHQKFIAKKNLSIMLLSDPDSSVQNKYGVWQPKKFMGRTFLGAIRSTFIVDKSGIIVSVWSPVEVKGHAVEVLAAIKKLNGAV